MNLPPVEFLAYYPTKPETQAMRENLLKLQALVVGLLIGELSKAAADGVLPAIGDGTFLQFLLQLLTILAEILKNLPDGI